MAPRRNPIALGLGAGRNGPEPARSSAALSRAAIVAPSFFQVCHRTQDEIAEDFHGPRTTKQESP